MEGEELKWLALSASSVTLYLYTANFFSQKNRIGFIHLFPIVAAIGVLWFPKFSAAYTLLILSFYTFMTIKNLNYESRTRGFKWFINPGARLAWFRNFIVTNYIVLTTLILSDSFIVTLISVLILQIFAFYPVVLETSFFTPIPLGTKYQKSTLTPQIKNSIVEKIDRVITDQEFYLRDDASLNNLAIELGVTTHHLSQVLNESMKIGFQDLISRYRIRKACQILKDESYEQHKIENVASMVGYNSKSAFNTAFKKKTGVTPSEYRMTKDVLTYGEELLSDQIVPQNRDWSFVLNHVFKLKTIGDMIRNFLKMFSRNIKRNGLFSFLNLLGLTVGFTCSILIYLYLQEELSYDKSIPDADRIYRIAWMNETPQTRTPHPMAQAMVRDFPEVEEAVSFSPWYGPGLSEEFIRVKNVKRNIIFEEPDFFFADSTFFDVFNLEFVEGDEKALSKPWSLIISEPIAKKYFGDSSAIGRELLINDMPSEVSAVVKPMPENSHFHFNAIIPYVTLKKINPADNWMTWDDFGHFNYIKLKEGADPKAVETRIQNWIGNYLVWWDEEKEYYAEAGIGFELQPIRNIHLRSDLRWELESNGNILYVYILTITLVFLLLIASINYINLTTAKSIDRAKEVGVRKTLGAKSVNLSFQFYLESVIFCLIATFISLGLVSLVLNGFNQLSGKNFEIREVLSFVFLAKITLLCLVIGTVAGLYPAIALSSYKPMDVLKGKLATSSKGVKLRSAMVVFQFAISAILISGSLIIFRQLNFMKNVDLGFDKDALVSLSIPVSVELGDIDLQKVYSVRQQIESINGVQSTTMMSNLPGGQFDQHGICIPGNPDTRVNVSEVMVDFGFEKTLGIDVLAGRAFNVTFPSDTASLCFMINEVAAQRLQLDDPVGKKIWWLGNDSTYEANIVGVVKNFHYQSLHQEIQPLIMVVDPYAAGHILVKLDGNQFSRVMSEIETIYSELNTELAFEYHFLDQKLAQLYEQEERTLSVFSLFAAIALVLASLGLLGMAIATLNQRIKEVGMRKILGASTGQIMQMIMGQFARLVLVALCIGLPISYLVMQSWLMEFSYQVSFGIMPFIWTTSILMVVALISVFSSVLKISFSHPAHSLRYE